MAIRPRNGTEPARMFKNSPFFGSRVPPLWRNGPDITFSDEYSEQKQLLRFFFQQRVSLLEAGWKDGARHARDVRMRRMCDVTGNSSHAGSLEEEEEEERRKKAIQFTLISYFKHKTWELMH